MLLLHYHSLEFYIKYPVLTKVARLFWDTTGRLSEAAEEKGVERILGRVTITNVSPQNLFISDCLEYELVTLLKAGVCSQIQVVF